MPVENLEGITRVTRTRLTVSPAGADRQKQEIALRGVDCVSATERRKAYLPFRNGRPVRLFTMTFLPGGMSVWRPDFGFFLLKK